VETGSVGEGAVLEGRSGRNEGGGGGGEGRRAGLVGYGRRKEGRKRRGG